MKIIFTSSGEGWDAKIDPRFGRTDFILLYNEETDELSSIDNREIQGVAHGAGPKTAEKIFNLGADVLITGNGPGGNAASILSKMPLRIYIKASGMTIREAYEAYKNNKLTKGA
ncbi:MAG: NifB/NifX family molybdenum-iron cluster-binding protein [Candidatus Cloacimonetes bacterium]|nr:dinitrogenase iron-molybdenum cofactor biosynthesis protein [Candidatus Cloacimonadota bacterium]MDD2507032.1 NifB/NifX family molybdenum-iron cluster-binding protein [Candidatus Cloacimonadota bacterium]MDD4148328.1 NifB/NifX family molybdenum-iron cluster-binding protein [Candidatus Cloacimonadota bacterium]MDD4559906.1 NifB/NifX family molybdenum-iron cluster-binding protein [Candidatus Cloacimonadota bacterium]